MQVFVLDLPCDGRNIPFAGEVHRGKSTKFGMITDVDGQNELVRSLQKQLEATERELANQKWVFERFLESPSWRITYPVRWMARQARALRNWVLASGVEEKRLLDQHHPGAPARWLSRHPSSTGEGNRSSP